MIVVKKHSPVHMTADQVTHHLLSYAGGLYHAAINATTSEEDSELYFEAWYTVREAIQILQTTSGPYLTIAQVDSVSFALEQAHHVLHRDAPGPVWQCNCAVAQDMHSVVYTLKEEAHLAADEKARREAIVRGRLLTVIHEQIKNLFARHGVEVNPAAAFPKLRRTKIPVLEGIIKTLNEDYAAETGEPLCLR